MAYKWQFRNFTQLVQQSPDTIAQQQTLPHLTVSSNPSTGHPPPGLPDNPDTPAPPLIPRRRKVTRIVAVVLTLALGAALFFIWFSPTTPAAPIGVTQQNFGGTSSTTNGNANASGDIHVYVVGAVKHPGVYTLPAGARVYQLLQAAGGALPSANLVALNLAAPLTDGQEVYVLAVGEVPPTYMGGVPGPGTSGTATAGQLVNINTASADELRQGLHISSTTAQNIVNYRLQHGPYTSVDQLLQVVSRSTYDKIKNLVTV